MNNLEYLFTHNRERILRNLTMEDDPCYICPKYDVSNPDVCDSDGRCTEVMREWLLAEHEDANDDFTPKSVVTAKTMDANDANARVTTMPLKMPSEIKVQYMDDESCNQVADQPKCVESPDCESDSREKLEADVADMVGAEPLYATIIEWLDRQAAITRHECSPEAIDNMLNTIGELEEQLEAAHAKNRALKSHISKMQEGRHGWHIKGKELQQQVDSLKRKLEAATNANIDYRDEWHRVCAERANLVREIGTLRAERDRYRELCGKLLDAADDMRRVRDAFDQFEKVDR